MMVKAGHDKARAGGLIASAGIIAPIIPPSIGFVVFGVAANVSISKLFLAGIVVAGVGRMRMDAVTHGVLPFMATQFAVMFLFVFFPKLVIVPMHWFHG